MGREEVWGGSEGGRKRDTMYTQASKNVPCLSRCPHFRVS